MKPYSRPRIIVIVLLLIGLALAAFYQVRDGFNITLSNGIIVFVAVMIDLTWY